MKNYFVGLATIAALSGCASQPQPIVLPKLTPQQVIAQVCPVTQAVLTTLNSPLIVLPIKAKADLAIASPIVDALCAAGAVVDLPDLQKFAQSALPNIVDVVASTAGVSQQSKDNLLAVQAIVQTAINVEAAQVK